MDAIPQTLSGEPLCIRQALWEQGRMLPHLGGSVSQMEDGGVGVGGGGGVGGRKQGRLASQ